MPRPRGAIATPRHRLAGAEPHRIIGVTPPQCLWLPKKLSLWLNDIDGDCTVAEEAFAKGCGPQGIFIPDAEVKLWATTNGFLNGALLPDVLTAMQASGFIEDSRTYNDGPHTSVDWTQEAVLQNAISVGPVKIGVAADQLENAVPLPVKNGWLATGFVKDENEDHCTSLCGYGSIEWLLSQLDGTLPGGVDGTQPGYGLFTWGSVGVIDVPSMLAITAEAWLRNPVTVVC